VYRPPLNTHCTTLEVPATVRISTYAGVCQEITVCDDRTVSEHIAVGGVFWVPEKPDEHVRGEFTAEVGKQPKVSLVNRVVDDPRVIPIAVVAP
jgi:hypothetical protein